MTKVFSNFEALEKEFPQVVELGKDDKKSKALKVYLENKGMLKLAPSGNNGFPVILYPDKLKIRDLIREAEQRKSKIAMDLREWTSKYNKAKNEEMVLHVKKLSRKEYWNHLAKTLTDTDYKADFEKANMKTTFAAHERWDRMFRMFVENTDYRKRLVETVNTSMVYANDKTLGKSSENLKEFVLKTSEEKMKDGNSKLEKLNEYLNALHVLNSLVKE